jgi:hypothetical protein
MKIKKARRLFGNDNTGGKHRSFWDLHIEGMQNNNSHLCSTDGLLSLILPVNLFFSQYCWKFQGLLVIEKTKFPVLLYF